MSESKVYPSKAISYAFERLREIGHRPTVKGACLEIGGKEYYDKVYRSTRNKTPTSISLFEPLIEKIPLLPTLLDEGLDRHSDEVEASVLERLDELKEMITRLIEQQSTDKTK